MIHIRLEGRSYDLDELALGSIPFARLDDHDIRCRVATYFDVSPNRLDFHIVDRRPNGDIIVRPEAVYG